MEALLHLIGPALGTVLSPISKYLQGRQDLEKLRIGNKHELDMSKERINEIEAEAQASIKVAVEATKEKTVEESYKEFGAAIRRDQSTGTVPGVPHWVLAVRALLIPFMVTVAMAYLGVLILDVNRPPEYLTVLVTNLLGAIIMFPVGHFSAGGFNVARATSPAPSTPLGWNNILARAKAAKAKDG